MLTMTSLFRKRSVLVVMRATGRDSGIYTCQATNIAGTSSVTTSVTIRHTGMVIVLVMIKVIIM